MGKYIIKRILLLIPILIGATFLVFAIMEISPGDPALTILGADANEEAIARIHEELGLDRPFIVRYGDFLLNLCKGDLGKSYRNELPVTELIMDRLPNTIILASAAIVLAIVIGLPVGIASAIKQYSLFDNVSMVFTLILAAAPGFWMGLVLIIVFSIKLHWFPSSGMGTGFSDLMVSLFLPALTLCGNTAARIARTTRSSMLEVIHQDYIDTARSKGVKESVVIFKHMLGNALIPIITVVGLQFGFLLGGSVVTESIFSWPGIGRFTIESINARDIPSVLGSVVTLSILFTFVNLIIDVAYAFVDPRIKSQYQSKAKGIKVKGR